MGQPLERIIALQIPLENLIEQIRGRRCCSLCGEPVNLTSDGLGDDSPCPICGGVLAMPRQHDYISDEDTLRAQARHYQRLTRYYRSQHRLKTIEVTGNLNDDFMNLIQALNASMKV